MILIVSIVEPARRASQADNDARDHCLVMRMQLRALNEAALSRLNQGEADETVDRRRHTV